MTSVAIPQPFNASTAKGAMTLITDDGDGDHIGRMSCALRLVCLMRRLRNEIEGGHQRSRVFVPAECGLCSDPFGQYRLQCRADSAWAPSDSV